MRPLAQYHKMCCSPFSCGFLDTSAPPSLLTYTHTYMHSNRIFRRRQPRAEKAAHEEPHTKAGPLLLYRRRACIFPPLRDKRAQYICTTAHFFLSHRCYYLYCTDSIQTQYCSFLSGIARPGRSVNTTHARTHIHALLTSCPKIVCSWCVMLSHSGTE